MPKRMEAVSIFWPLGAPNRSCTRGTITIRPKKPYTMEGMPASRSTAGFKILYRGAGQNFAI